MGAKCKGESSLSLTYRLPQGLRAVKAGSADLFKRKIMIKRGAGHGD